MKTYTIKQWFERVKDPKLKKELLANMRKRTHLVKSLKSAIIVGSYLNPNRESELLNMADENQIELLPLTKIKKSALDKRITGLQLKYELLLDRVEKLERQMEFYELKLVDPLAKTSIYNENEQTNVVGNSSDLPEKKIVLERFIGANWKIVPASRTASSYYKIVEIGKVSQTKYLFEAWNEGEDNPLIYIGHYE